MQARLLSGRKMKISSANTFPTNDFNSSNQGKNRGEPDTTLMQLHLGSNGSQERILGQPPTKPQSDFFHEDREVGSVNEKKDFMRRESRCGWKDEWGASE